MRDVLSIPDEKTSEFTLGEDDRETSEGRQLRRLCVLARKISLTHPTASYSSEAIRQSTINGASIELFPLITS